MVTVTLNILMQVPLTREILLKKCGFICGCSLEFGLVSAIERSSSVSYKQPIIRKKFGSSRLAEVCRKQYHFSSIRRICTHIQPEKIPWEGSSYAVILKRLEIALKDSQLDEAWQCFNDLKSLYGFPNDGVMHRLITKLSYSADRHWLKRAYDLVLLIWKEKPVLLQRDVLTKLSLSLARSQMPVPTSIILRLMLDIKSLPPIDILRLVLLHMVKTETGTCIASNLLVQICNCFLQPGSDKSSPENLMKPDTALFNLVLDACVQFKLCFKGHQIMELMPQTGVVADAHTIVLIAQIHDLNGQREELMKYKSRVDRVSAHFIRHYQQFYSSLLSLHFKFNDIDTASELVLDMCRYRKSLPIQKHKKDRQKSSLVPIGSLNLKTGLKMHIVPELQQEDNFVNLEDKLEFATFKNEKFIFSSNAVAKFIIGYRRLGKITELSKLLIHLQKHLATLEGSNLSSAVVDACIHLGWLDTAHDILDDMESAGAPMGFSTYTSLLKAYNKGKMCGEANTLLRQMRQAGLLTSKKDEMVISICDSEVVDGRAVNAGISTLSSECNLLNSLVLEIKDTNAISHTVFKLNSSIYYFCKAKMIEDALNTYKRMQDMGIPPTVQTFANLASAYSSLGMHREITILWGDIKRYMQSKELALSRDLFEFFLLCFLRGGYFERVMEVVGYMDEQKMYTDKWMYKSEFLKIHRNLYRSLKASQTRTEAQRERLEYVRAFRKWVGID